jgi:hypothetical protein
MTVSDADPTSEPEWIGVDVLSREKASATLTSLKKSCKGPDRLPKQQI